MSQLILKIVHVNWGMIGPGSWSKTIWRIYDDKSMEREDCYVGSEENRLDKKTLPDDAYGTILQNIDNIRNGKDSTDKHIDACDGEAWGYTQYEDGRSVWSRKLGYIYGIKSLEEIAEILKSQET